MPTTLRLAFTSCMDALRRPRQPLWESIAQARPDMLLLLGDQIYMDGPLAGLARRPALERAWHKADAHERRELLQDFAHDMHARYAAQWQVGGFQPLMADLRQRGAQVATTWDEHDFAWNNAYGAGTHERTVPEALADVAGVLQAQFAATLRQAPAHYPPLPADVFELTGRRPGFERLNWGTVPVLLTDQRSQRTARDQRGATGLPAATLLGDQWPRLEQVLQAAAAPGLVIVAGASPLRHPYLLAQQGWWAPDGRAYPEFEALLQTAGARAVLYLGGDVHRVGYGGPVRPGASVVQMLASGAALGPLLTRRFPSSWAMVELSAAGSAQARLDARLRLLSMQEGEAPAAPIVLHLAGGRWASPPPAGEAHAVGREGERHPGLAAAFTPLAMSVWRQRLRPGDDELALDMTRDDGNAYSDAQGSAHDWPEAAQLEADATGSPRLRRERADDHGQTLRQRLSQAFDRALQHRDDSGRGRLLCFIHGFGKPLNAAIDQALRLRQRHDVEPLLHTWPTGGEDAGLWATVGHGNQALALAQGQGGSLAPLALARLLRLLDTLAGERPQVGVTLLARSLGCTLLAHAAETEPLRHQGLQHVQRLVLSAAACHAGQHAQWVQRLALPTFIPVHGQDPTLRRLAPFMPGRPLGLGPRNGDLRAANATYLDLQRMGAARLHDHLLTWLGPQIEACNRQMLRETDCTAATLRAAGAIEVQP